MLKHLMICAAVFISVTVSALSVHAGVKARYVRVDNPTGFVFRVRQLEIYSGGENILRDHPEWVVGTTHVQEGNTKPDAENTIVGGPTVRACTDITNGDTDTSHMAEEWLKYVSPGDAPIWGPWFEIDLGREVEIEKIIYYGAGYPKRFYIDKGHRTVCTMTADRKVNWGVHWQYYDQKTYPDGVFAFDVTENAPGAAPILGRHIPPRAPDWVPMGWLLSADAENIPEDAEKRLERFGRRNSAEEIEKLAHRFFNILDDRTPGLEKAFEFYRNGKFPEALDAWKVYWFAKMKKVNQFQSLNYLRSYSACGDDLLEGLMVTIMSNEVRAIRYTPGRIRWIDTPRDRSAPDFRKKLGEALADGERKACIGSVCWPLVYSYRANPDPRYVERWAEILDDWSLNFFDDSDKEIYEVENLFTFGPGHDWCQFMEDLSITAEKRPEFVEAVPAPTLARAQMLALEKYTTAWWRQARETVFNHNTGGFYAYEPILFYIDEFHPGQRAAKEWRETFTRFLVLGNFRDGSLTEIGDEGHFEIATLLNVIVNRLEGYAEKPDWYTPGWKNHYFEWSDNLFKYMFRHLGPGGYEHRDKPDYRTYRWTSTTKPYWIGRPTRALDRDAAIFSIPEIRRLLGVFGFVSVPLPEAKDPVFPKEVIEGRWKPVHETISRFLENEKPELPVSNSDWMPYYGGYYFRGDWRVDSPFMHMVAGGACGGSEPWLYPYTMCYLYDRNFPLFHAQPLHVKNYPPQQIHGKEHRWKPGTKTSFLVNSDENPPEFRWSSTERIDFGEAVFDGAYQRWPGFRGEWDDTSLEMAPLPEAVENVRTVRQIVQLRKPRLFLIVDRVVNRDGQKHELANLYKIALSVKKDEPFETAKQLQLSPKEGDGNPRTHGTIRSENPSGPSLSIHQFADQPFCYRLEREEQPNFGRYACRLGGRIGIAEPTVRMLTQADRLTCVSLLASRGPDEKDRIVSIKPVGPVGFDARLQDGTEISCRQVRGDDRAGLSCGPVGASAELLVTVKEKAGETYGFVLGAESMSMPGRKGSVKDPDFEFRIADGKLRSTPILRPIRPVVFHPRRTDFADTETVEIRCETPEVEIRYTTDGTPPNRQSTLYTGPITITETTEFAARAYRLRGGKPYPEIAEDFELNGTKFTVPSYAAFRKRDAKPAVDVSGTELEPGMSYEYFEAPWWRLYASAHWLPAEKTGRAQRELDLSEVSTDKAYGMRFKGYIEIPEDGVYTFHAPEEIAKMIGAASYDLRVFVDDEEWSLSQFWHAQGSWSVPLKKGLHRFQVDFADARTKPWNRSGIWRFYPRPWTEHKGPPSDILLSGPGRERTRIPSEWLFREK